MAVNGSADDPPWLDGTAYRIWVASQSVARRFRELVEHPDVTVTQLGITAHLDELGPLSASDLARILKLTPQGVTKAIVQLEALGWVTRAPHPAHGRIVLYTITATGRAVARRGRADAAIADREIEELLDGFDIDAVRAALAAIRAGLDARSAD